MDNHSIAFNEDDLNDPELLAELEKLKNEFSNDFNIPSATKQEQHHHQVQGELKKHGHESKDIVSSPDIISSIDDYDQMIDKIEFKEDDLNDPDLLVQLSILTLSENNSSLVSEPSSKSKKAKTATTTNIASTISTNNIITDTSNNTQTNISQSNKNGSILLTCVEETSSSSISNELEITKLNSLHISYKRTALQYKRAGNMIKAKEMLSVAKSLAVYKEKVEMGFGLPKIFQFPPEPVFVDIPITTSETPESSLGKNHVTGNNHTTSIQSVQYSMTTSTNVTSTVMNSSISSSSQAIRAVKTSNNNTPKRQLQPQAISKPPPQSISILVEQLENQIHECTKSSNYLYKNNKKQEALEFHKLKKQLTADLELIKPNDNNLQQSNAIIPMPFLRSFHVHLEYEIGNVDIPFDVLQIDLIRLWDLSSCCSEEKPQTMISFQMDDLSAKTDVKEGMDPVYNHITQLNINRNKALHRQFERKRAEIKVFLMKPSASIIGWVIGKLEPRCIGKAYLKLDSLLTECEIHQVLQMGDSSNSRKLMDLKTEIRLSLRTPLVQRQLMKKEDIWWGIDHTTQSVAAISTTGDTNTPASVAQSSSSTTSPSTALVIPSSKLDESSKKVEIENKVLENQGNVQAEPTVIAKTPQSKSPQSTSKKTLPQPDSSPSAASAAHVNDLEEVEAALIELNNPDVLFSNYILETEHGQILQKLSSPAIFPSQKLDLNAIKDAYELRMNVLVVMVQTGKITIEQYIQNLQESIQLHKKWALLFKRNRNLEEAKRCLARCKLLDSELKDVQSSI